MIQDAAPGTDIEWCELGNVRLSRVGLARAAELVARWAGEAPFRLVVTPNVDHIMILQRDADFREAYAQAALVLLDGRPVQWAARWLGLPPLEKVSGSDLVPALCALGSAEGWRIFFLGGRTDAELGECLAGIRRRYPGLIVDGISPPLGFERDPAESARLIDAVHAFGGGLVMMACGSPKSEIWLARHAGALGRGVGMSIGAGLRMAAGLERRAPLWMQRAGLEWFWRMAGNPRHLMKRYLIDDIKFFPLVWSWKRKRK